MRRYFWVLSSLSLSLTILMVAIALASVLRSHITGLAASMLNVAYSLSGNLPGVFGRQKAALAFYSSSSSGLSTAATTAFAPTSLSTASRISQAQVSSSGAERSSKSISTMTTPEQNGAMPEPPLDSTQAAKQPELPKLSAEQFRVYNRLAVMMNQYHNHFRYTWNMLYKTCTSGSRPASMSIRGFISQGLHLCQALTIHHTIEERHVFPELAERMPLFRENDHLIAQHELIHEGLVKMENYLDACRTGERELRLPELKEVMDSFGEVLWTHLDDEVEQLGAENMRKYWTKEEILSMNW
ncbi:hypothetical protein PV05_00767 [Exophiala xenobiotica]|uniref:Hemerythrin-like domain-containing protein n=1 Tax=Exophiala xenobiotica TaxID=348802 RepID=A0A0D2F0X0_9EURO|nr:uncharacterized protein PV05_00767 [Exophiala xenobiotica]KIW60560.1 hypothetical protein PV05_00767 [Exophiala xenobiotica]